MQRHDIVFKGKQEMIWLLVLMLAWLTVGFELLTWEGLWFPLRLSFSLLRDGRWRRAFRASRPLAL